MSENPYPQQDTPGAYSYDHHSAPTEQYPYNNTGQYLHSSPAQHHPQPRQEHPSAMTVLILGIAGFFIPLLSFAAWFMGGKVRKEETQQGYAPSSAAQVGWVLGIVGSILQVIGIIFMFLAFVLFAAAVQTGTG